MPKGSNDSWAQKKKQHVGNKNRNQVPGIDKKLNGPDRPST